MGLLATIMAFGLWTAAVTTFTALDWAAYDFWLTDRAPIPVSSSLLIVTRDLASEEALGAGPLDRAILARLLTSAHESGALVIGLDHRLDHASPAQLGGAASDAMLLEAMSTAGPIVVVQSPEATLVSTEAIGGHLAITPHADRVTRTVPVTVPGDKQSSPAFGIALFEAFQQQTSPTKLSFSQGNTTSLLINYVGDGTINSFQTIPLSFVWRAIERHERDRLTEWFKGKIVVFLPNPVTGGSSLLPTGQTITSSVAHLHVLNMLLTGNHLYQLGVTSRSLLLRREFASSKPSFSAAVSRSPPLEDSLAPPLPGREAREPMLPQLLTRPRLSSWSLLENRSLAEPLPDPVLLLLASKESFVLESAANADSKLPRQLNLS